MTYRQLSAGLTAQGDFDSFLEELQATLKEGRRDPNEIVRDTLYQLYFGPLSATQSSQPDSNAARSLSTVARSILHTLDPRNITTEPEYYADIDSKQYFERKPYIWLWQMFDRSPLGLNALVGHRFRRILAPFIFRKVGENFKCWHFVEWTFGYNLSFGNDVIIHRHVLLDDRGGIEIGNQVSVSDYVNIYSHTHDIDDISTVYSQPTRIGDGSRITYHATVLAGTQIGDHAMVGTGAVVTADVQPYHIVVGIPAKTVKVKSPRRVKKSAITGE
jgi:acetyltransferase-like isoleucine patch superfamily enzyme